MTQAETTFQIGDIVEITYPVDISAPKELDNAGKFGQILEFLKLDSAFGPLIRIEAIDALFLAGTLDDEGQLLIAETKSCRIPISFLRRVQKM